MIFLVSCCWKVLLHYSLQWGTKKLLRDGGNWYNLYSRWTNKYYIFMKTCRHFVEFQVEFDILVVIDFDCSSLSGATVAMVGLFLGHRIWHGIVAVPLFRKLSSALLNVIVFSSMRPLLSLLPLLSLWSLHLLLFGLSVLTHIQSEITSFWE